MSDIFSSNLFSALLGTLFGAFLTAWLTKQNERVKLAMDFHKEWNSYEMSRHRRTAYHCIRKFPDSDYNQLTEIDENGSISLFIVLRFYQRLWKCFERNLLDKQLTANIFHENFYWYYFISFSTSLPPVQDDWTDYESVMKLGAKFREYTSEATYRRLQQKYSQRYHDYVAAKVAE